MSKDIIPNAYYYIANCPKCKSLYFLPEFESIPQHERMLRGITTQAFSKSGNQITFYCSTCDTEQKTTDYDVLPGAEIYKAQKQQREHS